MSILHRRMETLEQASAELARHLSALELVDLRAQVARLAAVLMEEFGGPTQSEGACEMAVRLLATLQEEKRVLVGALRRIAPRTIPTSTPTPALTPRRVLSATTVEATHQTILRTASGG
ncbi:hypothetical protein LCGC14_3064950 [marine sediment metagenome]|uniref:Uncharacterized protein n=1 Tax=marine sediment metagenome TaxID=412755 RepID=A0A0F8Z8J7_9ZZZZ